MRRRLWLVALALFLVQLGPIGAANAQVEPPPGSIGNVDYYSTLPSTVGAVSINFLTYPDMEVMVVSGRFGLRTYNLNDPLNPVLLDHFTDNELRLPGDTNTTGQTFWQNEDMEVDQRRKLAFMARDPRAYAGSTSNPASVAGVYIMNLQNPANIVLEHFEQLPTGHTSSCINECDFLWTGGPASSTAQSAEWPGGRPIIVTDIRDLDNIVTSPVPIDLFRNDGVTAYSHDVQTDDAGIAWVSGAGGIRGYHTDGRRYVDPVTGVKRVATPLDPVPFAGGKMEASAAPSGFMHNAMRPIDQEYDLPDTRGNRSYRPDELLFGTEEAFGSSTCNGVGQFVISTIKGSQFGQGWKSTPENPFRLQTVGTWNPHQKEGSATSGTCSAHYFDMQDNIVVYSWYAQGTRWLDISDPANPIQVGYYRPTGTSSYAPYFHGDYVYLADINRGVTILALSDDGEAAAAAGEELLAPPMTATQAAAAEADLANWAPDPVLGWACPIPAE